MARVLITGANKGLGYETARQLLAAGHTVYAGAREPERGRQAAERLGARFLHLDVTDDASVAAAAASIETDGGLDVLVNNAGVEGRTPDNGIIGPADETAGHMRALFDTNVFGIVRMLHAFLPLLQRSAAPVVVNLSSGLSKTADLANPDGAVHFYPGIAYPASKTAVNTMTVQYAKAFPRLRINAVDPGYTATDLNGGTGTQTVAEGAAIIVQMAQIGPDGPTGGYFQNGGNLGW
ncbi:MAG TPA: SDR family NAD(P)-dependent oxidoreductase [Streptosporangiaceae bacterium]|jgi:NAD(P)-dependent dehydrogenase (short-subunit alcohol dehydrogenase family)